MVTCLRVHPSSDLTFSRNFYKNHMPLEVTQLSHVLMPHHQYTIWRPCEHVLISGPTSLSLDHKITVTKLNVWQQQQDGCYGNRSVKMIAHFDLIHWFYRCPPRLYSVLVKYRRKIQVFKNHSIQHKK